MRFIAIFAALCLWPSVSAQVPPIAGDYIEARSNAVYGCYCEWSGESQTGGREAILGWAIREGAFEGIALAGLRLAAVIIGEATLSMGHPARKSILFLDSRATKPQQEAGESLLRRRFGDLLGKVIGVHVVPIDLTREADRGSLRIGDEVQLGMRTAKLPEDALQGAILWYKPFLPMKESTLGTTLNYKYWGNDFGQKWQLRDPGVTGYFGRFELAE